MTAGAKKYSLIAQITEINRELSLRERVYPNQVKTADRKETT